MTAVVTTKVRKHTFLEIRFFLEVVRRERFAVVTSFFLTDRRTFFLATLARFARFDLDGLFMLAKGRFFRGLPIFFFPVDREILTRGTERNNGSKSKRKERKTKTRTACETKSTLTSENLWRQL